MEIAHALNLQKVKFTRSGYIYDCQKGQISWTVEICRLEDLAEILLVKFRKTQGEMGAYREVCHALLQGMTLV